MQWIAASVSTGKEYLVRGKLKIIDPTAEILVPRKYYKVIENGMVKTKSEKMLPGYILIGSANPLNGEILKGFLKVVGKVTEEEIALLRAQEGTKEDILEVGIKVLVIEGPFQGCKGHIETTNKDGTLRCRVVFQGMEINMDMKSNILTSLK